MSDRSTSFGAALPFFAAFLIVPFIIPGALWGGWWIALAPVAGFISFGVLDLATGELNVANRDISTPDRRLFWFRAVTFLWVPVQMALIFGMIGWIASTDHLDRSDRIFLMISVGVGTGATGIVFAHEMIHQKSRLERALGELLLIMVLYGHFVTEHIQAHHRWVGTPRDVATARYNESYYRFLIRVLPGSFLSAWRLEAGRLAANGRPVWSLENPFWRYMMGGALFLGLAFAIGGMLGVVHFIIQAFVAILLLEQVNYMEHYGLVRQKQGERYEPVQPHHSWNAAHRFSNYLFVNLQRHSDHHMSPTRRFPLLQHHGEDKAPQLPFGYPLMGFIAWNPLAWRRIMNPRVRAWRAQHYPEIRDWRAAMSD